MPDAPSTQKLQTDLDLLRAYLVRNEAPRFVEALDALIEQYASALRVIEAAQIAYDGFAEDDHEFYGSQKRLAEALIAWQESNPATSPESPCSICGTYGHFTHNHERETSIPAKEQEGE